MYNESVMFYIKDVPYTPKDMSSQATLTYYDEETPSEEEQKKQEDVLVET